MAPQGDDRKAGRKVACRQFEMVVIPLSIPTLEGLLKKPLLRERTLPPRLRSPQPPLSGLLKKPRFLDSKYEADLGGMKLYSFLAKRQPTTPPLRGSQ